MLVQSHIHCEPATEFRFNIIAILHHQHEAHQPTLCNALVTDQELQSGTMSLFLTDRVTPPAMANLGKTRHMARVT